MRDIQSEVEGDGVIHLARSDGTLGEASTYGENQEEEPWVSALLLQALRLSCDGGPTTTTHLWSNKGAAWSLSSNITPESQPSRDPVATHQGYYD